MKIIFTGGGSGGHFYPIIAVAEKVRDLKEKEKIIEGKMYYMADSPYDKEMLFENDLKYVEVRAGKIRLYKSVKNILDVIIAGVGTLEAVFKVFFIFPDVVFGKGGYASFPALFAARLLRIPVVIHESDSYPGRVNKWAGKFAKRIALSWPEAAEHFPADRTAVTGQPIREELLHPLKEGAYEYLKFNPNIPVIFITGGSQGAQKINDAVLNILPALLKKYQVVHQVGEKNIKDFEQRAGVILENSEHKERYKPVPYLNTLAMRMVAGVSSLVISRGGSFIFEIAAWGIPSLIIPITVSNGDHQRKNAWSYARAGACMVLEESNITPTILMSEIDKILENENTHTEMSKAALAFSTPKASLKIAEEIMKIAITHEE